MIGRVYSVIRSAPSYLTLARFNTKPGFAKPRIALEILGQRWQALAVLLFLVVSTAVLDLSLSSRLADLDRPAFISDSLSSPSKDQLREIMGILAVAIAGVVAILFSISLVALQSAGERYGGRFVRFLLSEEVSRYVIELLFLTFLFSVWAVATVHFYSPPPIFTGLTLTALSLLSILSLPVYRDHALAALSPSHPARLLTQEINRLLKQVPSRSTRHTNDVEARLQSQAALRLDDLRSLFRALLERRDNDALDLVAPTYFSTLITYEWTKQRIPTASNWFPLKPEPITTADREAYRLQRPIYWEHGLGRPVQQVRDLEWFERNSLTSLEESVHAVIVNDSPELVRTVLAWLAHLLMLLKQIQARFAFDRVLSLSQTLALRAVNEGRPLETLTYAMSVGQLAIRSEDTAPWLLEAKKRYDNPSSNRKPQLPTEVVHRIDQMSTQLSTELNTVGSVHTPWTQLEPQLKHDFNEITQRYETDLWKASLTLYESIARGSHPESDVKLETIYGMSLLWHNALLRKRTDLLPLLPETRHIWAAQAILASVQQKPQEEEWRSVLLEQVTHCLLREILSVNPSQDFELSFDALLIRANLRGLTEYAALDLWHRIIAICALALFVGEARSQPSLVDRLIHRISYINQNDWHSIRTFSRTFRLLSDPASTMQYGIDESASYKYFSYHREVEQELRQLPVPPASPFIRRHWHMNTIEFDVCASEFVKRLHKIARPPAKHLRIFRHR